MITRPLASCLVRHRSTAQPAPWAGPSFEILESDALALISAPGIAKSPHESWIALPAGRNTISVGSQPSFKPIRSC
jgi:hypothetical protein